MSVALSLNGSIMPNNPARSPAPGEGGAALTRRVPQQGRRAAALQARSRHARRTALLASASRADDSSSPFDMSVEDALKLLGVAEGASFDEILRAKKGAVAACKDDQEAVGRVETAYDMLLMQSLTQRRAGKVVSSSIRYADVKPVRSSETGALPQWLQTTVKNVPVSVEAPSSRDLGIQAGVYGALMVFAYASESSTSAGVYSGPNVPGIILATGFGASIYFFTRKTLSLGKATLITSGSLAIGAVVGSLMEKWLQVEIVSFFGIHSPEVIVTEVILFSQLVVSLYLR